MASDSEVLIKIAADVNQAVQSITSVVASMADMAKAMLAVADANKQAKKDSESLGEFFGKQLSKAFDGAKEAALDFAKSLPNAVGHVAELGDSLLAMNQRTGLSVESLSELRFVASQSGVSFELLGRSIQQMSKEIAAGGADTINAVEDIGLSFATLQAQKPEEQFYSIMSALKAIQDPVERTAKGVELLGPKFSRMSNLATEDMGKLVAQAKELGLTMSEDTARAADAYGDSIDRLNKKMEATRDHVGAMLLVPLTSVIEKMGDAGGAVLLFGDALVKMGKAASGVFINMLPQIVDKLGGWSKALDYAKGKTTDLIAKIWLQVTATTALNVAQTEATVTGKAWATIQGVVAVATMGVTAAVKLLTTAMYENPVLAIIAGLIALGLALWALKGHYDKVGEAAVESTKEQLKNGGSILALKDSLIKKEGELQEAQKKGDVFAMLRLNAEIKALKSSEDLKKAQEDYNTAVRAGYEGLDNIADVTEFLAEKQAEHNRELKMGADAQRALGTELDKALAKGNEGKTLLESYNTVMQEKIRLTLLDSDTTSKWIKDKLGWTDQQIQKAKEWLAVEKELSAQEAQIAAQREQMGLTGVSAALAKNKSDAAAAQKAVDDAHISDPAERARRIQDAADKSALDRQNILTDAARTATQTRIQLAADAAIAEVNASKKGLDAQLAIIDIRKNAEIAAARVSGDYVTAGLKIQEAEQKAQQQKDELRRTAREASDEKDLARAASNAQALIEIYETGFDKATDLVDARAMEADRIARKTITDEQALGEELARIWQDATDEKSRIYQAADVKNQKDREEAARKVREAEIREAEFGIDQVIALRAVEWERRKQQAEDGTEDLAAVEKEFQEETQRLIKEGDDVTIAGRERKAKAAEEAYLKANKNMNVSDAERQRLYLAALKARADAEGVVFRKSAEATANEIRMAAIALANIKAKTDATWEQVEAAQELLDIKVLEAQVDEESRRRVQLAQAEAKRRRLVARGARPEQIAESIEDAATARGYHTRSEAEEQIRLAQVHLEDLKNKGAAPGDVKAAEDAVKRQKELAGQTVTTWGEALESITASFEQMANIAGAKWGGVLQAVGMVFSQMKTAGKEMKVLLGKDAQGNQRQLIPGMPGWEDENGDPTKAASGVAMAAQVAGGVQSFLSGTDKRTAGARALGGAQAGAQIGAIAGPWGAAIGAGVGAIVGALRKPGWVKAAKDVGRDFGVEISDELAKTIEESSKKTFKGDRSAGSLFNLDAIIGEAGGLKSGNIDKFTGKLRDVFSMVESGKFSAEQGRETLEKNFGAFADYVVKSNKVASKGFQELLTLNANSAAKSEEVIGFVSSQNQRLASGLTGLFAPLSKQIGDMVDARKKLSDAQASGKEIDLDSRLVLQESAKDIKNAGDQMQRFERLTLAGFNAAVAAGVPYLDALDQMGPALDQLSDANKKLGREGGAAINELLGIRELAKTYPELVASASSLNEVTMAMSNIGALNVDTMADLQEQGEETFGKLVEAGFSETQALQQMKGYLENVRQAHKDLGLPIDENTQLLINQAEKTGVLKAESMSTNEVMMEGFSAIIKALKGDIPAAFTKMKEAALENAKVTAAALEHVEASVGGIDGALEDSEDAFAGWSAEAIAAAQNAQDAVDAVSFGSSPGGIKEMPIKLKESIQAFKDWQKVSVGAAGAVRDAIDASAGSVDGINYAGQIGAGARADELARQQEEVITMNVAINTIDTQGMEEAVEKKMLPAMSKILRKGGRNLSDIQGVLR